MCGGENEERTRLRSRLQNRNEEIRQRDKDFCLCVYRSLCLCLCFVWWFCLVNFGCVLDARDKTKRNPGFCQMTRRERN